MTKRGQARTFNEDELESLLQDVTNAQAEKRNSQPAEVMRVAFMLSFFAGLRVQEIAGLRWDVNVFNGTEFRQAPTVVYGQNGKPVIHEGKPIMQDMDVLWIDENIGKYGKARNIPLHPRLKRALSALRDLQLEGPYVIPNAKAGASPDVKHRAHALKMRINRLYKALGVDRASSHSGRRSFGTRAARRAEAYDNSLVDVRDLMGHASINTTQQYVDPSARQGDLVNGVW